MDDGMGNHWAADYLRLFSPMMPESAVERVAAEVGKNYVRYAHCTALSRLVT